MHYEIGAAMFLATDALCRSSPVFYLIWFLCAIALASGMLNKRPTVLYKYQMKEYNGFENKRQRNYILKVSKYDIIIFTYA